LGYNIETFGSDNNPCLFLLSTSYAGDGGLLFYRKGTLDDGNIEIVTLVIDFNGNYTSFKTRDYNNLINYKEQWRLTAHISLSWHLRNREK